MDEIKSEYQDDIFPNDDSEADHDQSFTDLFQSTPHDYWYGKKCFEEAVAQVLFLNWSGRGSMAKIDSRFETLIQIFPYGEAIQSLRGSSSRLFGSVREPADGNEYTTLLELAGMTIRDGTDEDKALLFTTIGKYIGAQSSRPPPDSSQRPNIFIAASKATPKSPPPPPQQDNGVNAANMGFYSLRLKEKADLRGIKLDYDIERNPNDPETFRAQLLLYGRTFVGIGRSKPLAKHQASKEACAWLDARPENIV